MSTLKSEKWRSVRLLSVFLGGPGGPYSRYLHKAHELGCFSPFHITGLKGQDVTDHV